MVGTETTRRKYRREGLRYASGTTDGEWAVLEPLLPPARRGWDGLGSGMRARSSMRSSMFSPAAASGARCRGTSLRARRCRGTSIVGAMTEAGIGSPWRSATARRAAPPLSQAAPHLRRPCLPGPAIARRHRPLRPVDHRDRRAPAGRQKLPTPAPAMGRRAHVRVAWPKPTPCKGLRGNHRKRYRMAAPCKHTPTLQTARKSLIQIHSFRVRL